MFKVKCISQYFTIVHLLHLFWISWSNDFSYANLWSLQLRNKFIKQCQEIEQSLTGGY